MPRPPRLLLSHSFYHVMTRGNNRHTVFYDNQDFDYFLEIFAKYKKLHPFNLYHYCLMPNHTHLLLQTKDAQDFAVFMKKLNLAYFHYYNKRYGWIGHFWQDRYKSQAVGKDSYFIQCGKYIELNPVRADLVEKPEDYRYSSYKYYGLSQADDLITSDFLYETLGSDMQERQQVYAKLIVENVVLETGGKQTWGSYYQRKNEYNKLHYHLTKKEN